MRIVNFERLLKLAQQPTERGKVFTGIRHRLHAPVEGFRRFPHVHNLYY
jgi:hypothetical protein